MIKALTHFSAIFLAFLLFAPPLIGQEQSVVHAIGNAGVWDSLHESTTFLIASSEKTSVQEILRHDQSWRAMKEKPLGYNDSQFWFRTLLENTTDKAKTLTLMVKNPMIDSLQVYLVREDTSWQVIHKAASIFPEHRYKFEIPPRQKIQILAKTHFAYQTNFPLRLFDEDSLDEFQLYDHLYIFASFGILLGLLIYNFFVYLSLREKSHLCYLLYALFALLVVVFQSGYGPIFFGSSWLWLNNTVNQMAVIWSMQFARTFLGTDKRTPRLDQVMRGVSTFGFIHILICALVPWTILKAGFDINLAVGCIVVISAGILVYRQGYAPAKFYLLSWIAPVSCSWFWFACNYGLISDGFGAAYAMNLGVTLEMILISMALGERVNMIRRELFDALKNANSELESRVQHESNIIKIQQQKLINSTKMSALGEMAAGVAHEINNPLAIIRGKAEILRRIIEKDDVNREQPMHDKIIHDIQAIEASSTRIAKVTQGLLTFASGDDSDPMIEVSLSDIITDVLRLCRERFKMNGIRVETKITIESNLRCRDQQIVHSLLSLLSNSYDAVAGAKDKWVKIEASEKINEFEIRVINSGAKISDHIVDRITEPFFTTKEIGKGTGLGLSIVKGVINDHGGEIFVDRAAMHTTIVMTLPKSDSRRL